MNNWLGETQGIVSAEQPIEGFGQQGERACALSSWGLASHSTKPPGWTADKNAHVQWEQQVARRTTRIAQVYNVWIGVGEIEESGWRLRRNENRRTGGTETSVRSSGARQQWDKIQRKEREASIPKIEQSRSLEENLVQSLTPSRTPENE